MTDKDYIKLIKTNDNQAVTKLYNGLRRPVLSFLSSYPKLSPDDRLDVFQETLVCLVNNIQKDGFALTCKLETYAIAICKNIASNVLRKVSPVIPIDRGSESFDVIDVVDSGDDVQLRIEKDEETSMMRAVFRQIGNNCRLLLTAFYYDEKSYKEIVETLGIYQNEDSAKTAKNKCINKMRSAYEMLKC